MAGDVPVWVARRCQDVDELARPFTRLRPALAHLWLERIRMYGWTWPLPDPGRGADAVAFLDPTSDRVVARGHCELDGTCTLADQSGRATWVGSGSVSIEDLRPFAP